MSGLVIGQAAGRKGVSSVALTVPSILAVTGSPITDSGTFAISLATQNANLVLAGPTSGGANTPTFRTLVVADIPTLDDTRLANAVILAPAASARNVIQPTGVAIIPLIVKGAAAQSANLQEWQNSGGTALMSVSPSGVLSVISALSGTGAKIGYSGSGSIASSDNHVYGMWMGQTLAPGNTKIGISVYGGGIISVTSPNSVTAYAIYAAGLGKLGTGTVSLAAGVYIADQSLATDNYGLYSVATKNFFSGNVGLGVASPGAKLHVLAATSGIGLIVRAAATTPGNIQEWHNNGGTAVGTMGASGDLALAAGLTTNNSANRFVSTGMDRIGGAGHTLLVTGGVLKLSTASGSSAPLALGTDGVTRVTIATGTGVVTSAILDAVTATVTNALIIDHQSSSGTPAAGFGQAILFSGQSATTAQRNMARLRTEWVTATDASRASKMVLSVYAIGVETDAVHILSDGKVGIKVASPETGLQVGDATTVTTFTGDNNQGVRIGGSGTGSYSLLQFSGDRDRAIAQIGALQVNASGTTLVFGTSNNYATGITNTAMSIDPSGNVGIGITPTKLLHISKSDTDTTLSDGVAAVIRVSNPSATLGSFAGIEFGQYSADYTHAFIGAVKTDGTTTGASDLVFATKATTSDNTLTEYMRIKAGGGVGIGGTPIAGRLLHVISATSPVIRLSGGAASNQYIEFDQNGTTKGVIGFNTSDTMQIAYGANFNTNYLAINSSGFVGVGISPTRLLTISAAQPFFRLNSSNTALADNGGPIGDIEFYANDLSSQGTGIAASIKAITARTGGGMDVASELVFSTRIGGGAGANAAEVMVLDRTGQLGLGITAPTAKLHIQAAASGVGAIIKGNATTPGNLIEFRDSGNVLLASVDPTGVISSTAYDAATNTVKGVLGLAHNTSGTPAAGFGTAIVFYAQSSTTSNRGAGRIRTEWTTATDASRASKMVLSTYAIGAETDAVTILSNGFTGINIAAPEQNLHVNGTVMIGGSTPTTNTMLQIRTSGTGIRGFNIFGTTGQTADLQRWNTDSTTQVACVSASGSFGIGVTLPSSKLDVSGDIEIPFENADYFGDPTTDGSIRLKTSGTNLLVQRRIAGVWTTQSTL